MGNISTQQLQNPPVSLAWLAQSRDMVVPCCPALGSSIRLGWAEDATPWGSCMGTPGIPQGHLGNPPQSLFAQIRNAAA